LSTGKDKSALLVFVVERLLDHVVSGCLRGAPQFKVSQASVDARHDGVEVAETFPYLIA
jgi:hypothetical protein